MWEEIVGRRDDKTRVGEFEGGLGKEFGDVGGGERFWGWVRFGREVGKWYEVFGEEMGDNIYED